MFKLLNPIPSLQEKEVDLEVEADTAMVVVAPVMVVEVDTAVEEKVMVVDTAVEEDMVMDMEEDMVDMVEIEEVDLVIEEVVTEVMEAVEDTTMVMEEEVVVFLVEVEEVDMVITEEAVMVAVSHMMDLEEDQNVVLVVVVVDVLKIGNIEEVVTDMSVNLEQKKEVDTADRHLDRQSEGTDPDRQAFKDLVEAHLLLMRVTPVYIQSSYLQNSLASILHENKSYSM